jgi:glycosyltransferase involved in cell wall biosynthesis
VSAAARPLKVLHVISGDLWAGAEVQAATLLAALRSVVSVAAALMNDGVLAAQLRSLNIPVNIFDESRLNGAQILLALRQLMLTWQPDVVHTHRTKENILGSLANRLAGNVPCVRTVHGASEDTSSGWRRQVKSGIAAADRWCGSHLQQRIVAVSPELATKLARRFAARQIVTIENGIDIATVRARVHPVEFRDSAPRALHVGISGRLVPVKRVDLFLECAALVRAARPEHDWRFHVFGDGPLRGQLERQAQRIDIYNSTTFHGHRDDSVACLASLDALVICSDHEGLPMVLLEALVVGTPVLAHATGGMVDVLKDSVTGRVVHDHSAAGYAEALPLLIAAGVPDRATNRVPDRYTATHNKQAIESLYRQLSTPREVRAGRYG